uniref:SJCHGC09733 protein n=1 Tax=Schistosoma japonicum TaxID=6182 RepID=Q5BR09_SCHJA|nr:SJCHGC09733 protein [Schistosoma japonicum]
MDRIRALNLKPNPDKCRFRVSEVQYVGHLLTDMGVKPDPGKTEAVRLMPTPENKLGLGSSMTNYLSKFIQRYREVPVPCVTFCV